MRVIKIANSSYEVNLLAVPLDEEMDSKDEEYEKC